MASRVSEQPLRDLFGGTPAAAGRLPYRLAIYDFDCDMDMSEIAPPDPSGPQSQVAVPGESSWWILLRRLAVRESGTLLAEYGLACEVGFEEHDSLQREVRLQRERAVQNRPSEVSGLQRVLRPARSRLTDYTNASVLVRFADLTQVCKDCFPLCNA